ncbi:MAG: flagellar biosynthesis protein FlhB [Pirellulaceae bacterium]
MTSHTDENRTEQPTPRKLERSREKGQVAYSGDFTNGIALLIISLAFALVGDWFLRSLLREIVLLLSHFGPAARDEQLWTAMLTQSTWQVLLICLPVVLITFFSTLLMGGLMTGFQLSPKAFEWDFEKLSPVKGFSKLFSARSLVRGVMSLFKLSVISAIVYFILIGQYERVAWSTTSSLEQAVDMMLQLLLMMMAGMSGGLVVLGIGDFAFQKWKHIDDLKMSRQELRDERKEEEGDPHVRARLKRLQREMSQRRMLQDVPTSDVLITNPTHYAVALRYNPRDMSAPVVVAKGCDHLALKIIKIAETHDVPRVERKPLARALYSQVEVGGEIPLELYQAVAEVLAYIQSIDRQLR